jgi:DNA-binding XRE family transcriptional regulator
VLWWSTYSRSTRVGCTYSNCLQIERILRATEFVHPTRYTPSLPLALALARLFATTVEEMFDADH